MNRFRLAVSSLAVVALTLGAITGIGVLPAAADTVTDGDFTYSFDPANVSAGATITDFGRTGGDAVIPATVLINGTNYAVTTIGDSAFAFNALTSLVIGANVTKIENWAFYSNNLTTVTIPNNVTTIGKYAFRANKLTTATVGTGVTIIGDYAFEGNALTSLTLGTKVTDIGDYAFSASSLTKVAIPSNVTTIGRYAFSSNKLTSVTLGTKVTDVGAFAFFGNLLTSLTIPNSVTIIGDSAFEGNSLTSLTMGTGVTTIGDSAFRSNNLKTVAIGAGVTGIGNYAFQNNKLSKVIISNNVKTIGERAFSNNFDLAALTLGTSVTGIGAYAFEGGALKSVAIPNSVETIGEHAFASIFDLTTLTLGASVISIGDSAFVGNALTTVTIPGSVETIGARAFQNNDLTTVTIPEGVTTIGEFAFDSNELTTVSIPRSITTISKYAFASNYSLTSLSIPFSVTAIGKGAFINNSLTTVTIPSSVASIDGGAFANSSGPLTTVLFLGEAPTIASDSFGTAAEKTLYYLPASESGFESSLNGYATAEASALTTSPIPEICCTVKVGRALTARLKKWTPAPTLSYEWTNSDGSTVLGRNATYTTTTNDLGKKLTVTVTGYAFTYTGGVVSGVAARTVSSDATTTVALGTFAPAPTPLVSGTKQVGSVLTADPGDFPDGTTFTYQWKRAGVDLTGDTATSARYTVVAKDLGKKLSVTVTADIDGYEDMIVTSAATTAIAAGTFGLAPTPVVSVTAQVGEPLSVLPGTWNTGTTLTYAWKRSGSTAVISTSTDGRYIPVNADIGKTLTVTVTATRDGFTTLSKTSAATAKVIGSPFTTVVPTISGASDNTATVGTTLTAVPGTWDPVPTTVTYVWKRTTSALVTTVISGATKISYTPVLADIGKTITVTVTGSKTLYATTSVTSDTPGVLIRSAT